MKICSVCKAERPRSQYNARRASRDGLCSACRECQSELKKESYKRHKAEAIARAKRGEKRRLAASPAFRNSWSVWKALKPTKRIPKWVRHARDILPIYEACKNLGVGYEVDHIIPLRSKTICGLHVPNNLRITSREANTLKSNSFDEALLPLYDSLAKVMIEKASHPRPSQKRDRPI